MRWRPRCWLTCEITTSCCVTSRPLTDTAICKWYLVVMICVGFSRMWRKSGRRFPNPERARRRLKWSTRIASSPRFDRFPLLMCSCSSVEIAWLLSAATSTFLLNPPVYTTILLYRVGSNQIIRVLSLSFYLPILFSHDPNKHVHAIHT